MTGIPWNMYAIGQRVWLKEIKRVGTITRRWWEVVDGHNRAHYHVEYNTARPGEREFYLGVDVRTSELRTADWCCDACGRWLPNGSREMSGDEVDLCFLCCRSNDRDMRKMRDMIEYSHVTAEDIEYERAQASEEWERQGGGGL
jgi:hypothetical protein